MRKRFNIFKFAVLLCLLSVSAREGLCEDLTAQEIIKRQDDLMRGDTSEGTYKMTVVTPNWQRTLELTAYSKGRDRTFIRILAPVKEEGITTLRIENNMWNYLPNVERTIKIPPSMMLQPWMGSDYSNDDLVKESSIVYDYTHNIIGEEKINDDLCYKIELTPKPDAPVVWGKLIFWVSIDNFLPLREEFYSEKGKLIKVLEYSQVRQMNDRSIPALWLMTSGAKEGHSTIIQVMEVIYNQPIDDNIFTLANLKSSK